MIIEDVRYGEKTFFHISKGRYVIPHRNLNPVIKFIFYYNANFKTSNRKENNKNIKQGGSLYLLIPIVTHRQFPYYPSAPDLQGFVEKLQMS